MKHASVSNTYLFQCFDSAGNIKKCIKAHNTVLNNFCMYDRAGPYLGLVLGAGLAEPLASDTQLDDYLFSAEASQPYVPERVSDTHIKVTASFVVPADAQHAGTISEFGLVPTWSASNTGDNNSLITRGLLKDSEGQTITIEKTDLDRLTVDVEVHIQLEESDGFYWLTNAASHFMRLPGVLSTTGTGGFYAQFYTVKPHKKYGMSHYLCGNLSNAPMQEIYMPFSRDTLNLIWRLDSARLPQVSSLDGHYVQSVELERSFPVCAWYFPSEQLPVKVIDNIVIGVGDGTTTTFEPPIGLWLENTDKLYVAGIQQTRNTDYTIEHNANRQRLLEITPGAFVDSWESSGDYTDANPNILAEYYPIPFSAYADLGICLLSGTSITIKLLSDGTVGDKVNYWIPGRWYYREKDSSFGRNPTDAVISLYSSEDGEIFTHRSSYTYSSDTCSTPQAFTACTDKYWRLTCDLSNTDYPNATMYPDRDTASILGYYGAPIVFTNPPADGAKITMSLQLDRPYKNENFIMDICPEFRFGGA